MLAVFLPFVLSQFYLLPEISWRPSGPVLVERVYQSLVDPMDLGRSLPSWLPWFSGLVFWGWVAKTLAGRFGRAVLLSFALTGMGITLLSAWSTAAVLSMYPWNGPLVFARWAAIYALFVSLFMVGLWLGGRLRFTQNPTAAAKARL